MKKKLWLLVLLCLAPVCGCNIARYCMYLMFGGSTHETIEAEYEGLENSTVAIVVYADHKVRYEYRWAQLEVSSAVLQQLEQHIREVKVIDPRQVLKYQAENINWDSMSKTELGKAFNSNYVLFITLVEFTTREPGSINLYRGQITAEVSLWKTSLPQVDARVWHDDDLSVRYPEKTLIGEFTEDENKIRYDTEMLFANKLVRRFYKHKVEKKP